MICLMSTCLPKYMCAPQPPAGPEEDLVTVNLVDNNLLTHELSRTLHRLCTREGTMFTTFAFSHTCVSRACANLCLPHHC